MPTLNPPVQPCHATHSNVLKFETNNDNVGAVKRLNNDDIVVMVCRTSNRCEYKAIIVCLYSACAYKMQDRKGIVSQSITSAENDTGWTLCSRILFTKKEKEKVFFSVG